MRKKIAILGGGISGLSNAFLLLKHNPGASVYLYEKSPTVGGALSSYKVPDSSDAWLELGPSSVRKSLQINEIMKIISEAGLLPLVIRSTEYPQVYLYYDNKLRVFPRSFRPTTLSNFAKDNRSFLTSFLKPSLNMTEKKRKFRKDCSIKEFLEMKTRLGFIEFKDLRYHLYQISGALFNGIYASDISELSSSLCLKKSHHDSFYGRYFKAKEYKKYEPEVKKIVNQYLSNSSSFTFKDGLNTFPQGILRYLQGKYPENFKVKLGSEISNLSFGLNGEITVNMDEKFDMVISALPLSNLLTLLSSDKKTKDSKLFRILESIKLKSLARVSFYFDKIVIPNTLQSFGFLTFPKENEETLGMTFDSRVFPLKQDETRCSVMIGDEIVRKNNFNEEKLIEIAKNALVKKLGTNVQAKEVKIKLWKNFMPVFSVHHYEKMQSLFSELSSSHPNFKITGNFIFSAAIPEIILFNKCLVSSISEPSS